MYIRKGQTESERIKQLTDFDKTFDGVFNFQINEYCNLYNIQDMREASQQTWVSCLMEIYKNVFKENKSILKINNNEYDPDIVLIVLEIYIKYTIMYNKEVNQHSFDKLIHNYILPTEYNNNSIYNTKYNNDRNKINPLWLYVSKRLSTERQNSLADKLSSGKGNSIGILAILNHFYSWNLPTATIETAKIERIARDEKPNLTDNFRNDAPELPT